MTKFLDNHYRNHTPQQVRDDLFNKLCISLIIFWLVMAGITVIQMKNWTMEVESGYDWPSEQDTYEVEYQEHDTKKIWDTREYKQISYIVVHHTATRDDLTAEQMKLSMERTYINNRWWKIIPTHYIIDKRGNLERVNPINVIVWATLNPVANIEWVHIELVWDFNLWHPTQHQYDTLNSLIRLIENEVNAYLPIRWHKDFQAKNCPWVNFDWGKVKNSRKLSIWDEFYYTKITAYYAPLPTDTIFSHWTYERSKAVNGDLVNAMWWDYKEDHKYTHWACWKRLAFWTVLEIDWRGRVVCVDTWGAIDNESFDIWYWIGEEALRNIRGWKAHPQQAKVRIVGLP